MAQNHFPCAAVSRPWRPGSPTPTSHGRNRCSSPLSTMASRPPGETSAASRSSPRCWSGRWCTTKEANTRSALGTVFSSSSLAASARTACISTSGPAAAVTCAAAASRSSGTESTSTTVPPEPDKASTKATPIPPAPEPTSTTIRVCGPTSRRASARRPRRPPRRPRAAGATRWSSRSRRAYVPPRGRRYRWSVTVYVGRESERATAPAAASGSSAPRAADGRRLRPYPALRPDARRPPETTAMSRAAIVSATCNQLSAGLTGIRFTTSLPSMKPNTVTAR